MTKEKDRLALARAKGQAVPAQKDETHQSTETMERARARHRDWHTLWQDCYDYTLPQAGNFSGLRRPGQERTSKIFDATAMDAVDQLAASLLGSLTPTWSQWFGLKPGPDLSPQEAERLAPLLEKTARVIQDHFDRSNFAVEIHQAYLDLIVGGTGSLYFQESDPGHHSAFKFAAVPLAHVCFEEGDSGLLDHTYRALSLTREQMMTRYLALSGMEAEAFAALLEASPEEEQAYTVYEIVEPVGLSYRYRALLMRDNAAPVVLAQSDFAQSPFINFRWVKFPGEIYGRSPVMKTLPDIKTANKIVELVLKNASIAVTGIWQADDDGVLNPANINLTPGSIIPKAIGSKGLQPLEMPGRFDVSELMLESLQARIRHALLTDKLGPLNGPRMTATEVLERAAQVSLLLGATYGRLQSELLTPLIMRAFSILKRRGEVPDIALDGRYVAIDYRSPLARAQGQRNVQNTLSWVNSVIKMGAEGAASVNIPQTVRYLGEALGVPSDLVHKDIISRQTLPAAAIGQVNTQSQHIEKGETL